MRAAALVAALVLTLAPFGARAVAAAPMQRISGKRIATLAAREIAALSSDGRDYVAVSSVPDQLVAPGAVALRAGAPVGSATFVSVPVSIAIDGKLNRTVFVGYRVQSYVETAVAAHDLAPGTVIAPDDVVMAKVPDTGRPANGTDVLIGRRLPEAAVKGQPIAIMSTIENQIVKAGSTVVFIVRDNGVEITADVIARTGGGLGDQVFVYNPLTRKALSGTVTAPGTVVLDISGGDAQ